MESSFSGKVLLGSRTVLDYFIFRFKSQNGFSLFFDNHRAPSSQGCKRQQYETAHNDVNFLKVSQTHLLLKQVHYWLALSGHRLSDIEPHNDGLLARLSALNSQHKYSWRRQNLHTYAEQIYVHAEHVKLIRDKGFYKFL